MSDGAVAAPPAAPFRKAGPTVYVSGQVGVDEQWVPLNDTFANEARQAFRNSVSVLEEAGAVSIR